MVLFNWDGEECKEGTCCCQMYNYRDGVTGFTNLEWSLWQVHMQQGRRVHQWLVLT